MKFLIRVERLFRLNNVIIVALLQYILFYLILYPIYHRNGLEPFLDSFEVGLFILLTCLITMGGYLINDFYDYQFDLKNKDQPFVTPNFLLKAYFITVFMGSVIAMYLAVVTDSLVLLPLYPAAVFGLFLYSNRLKGMGIVGNLVVALYAALVAYIVFIAELPSLVLLPEKTFLYLQQLFLIYSSFAFLSNFYREIVKDLEDKTEDERAQLQTLPIMIGEERTRIIAIFVGFILLLMTSVLISAAWNDMDAETAAVGIVGLVLPLSYTLFKGISANSSLSYHDWSLWIKIVMIAGLIFLLILHYDLQNI